MIKITQIKNPIGSSIKIEDKLCSVLKISRSRLLSWRIARRSIEARSGHELSYVYTVYAEIKDEATYLKKNRNKNVTKYVELKYTFPLPGTISKTQNQTFVTQAKKISAASRVHNPPVVIGSGPAGLFCAYCLAKAGLNPVVLERGGDVDERARSVDTFWKTGVLNTESNVQFGEGGAGTFSDGKLNTGINDKTGRIGAVLETFVKHGAPQNILYDAMPHIGTDILRDVIKSIRIEIISLGGSFYFNTRADEILLKEGRIIGVRCADKIFDTDVCVAAIGHSARDTVKMLYEKNAAIEPKAFAVGVRIQHEQEMINKIQWGEGYPKELGAAAYRLAGKLKNGRSVYTFCMCPGGYVINASSEDGRLAVNGMSYSGRASGAANSAVILSVTPDDYLKYENEETPKALSTIAFQRELEERAFKTAGGAIPVQRFEDYKNKTASIMSEYEPRTKGAWRYADLREIFPDFLSDDLASGIEELGKKLRGFAGSEALLMGVESRTSSPVRIIRNENFQSNIEGLYPCGEGAGYAGGITSAAADGVKVAEAVAYRWKSYTDIKLPNANSRHSKAAGTSQSKQSAAER